MCSNGRYTERGIKQVHGFMSERWRIEPEYVVRVDKSLGLLGVLLEPTTVVAKAWEQILTIGQRTFWDPRTVLVVGAGPIGLLAALIGVQRGARGPRARPGHDRSEAGAGRSSSAPPTTPGRSPTSGCSPDIVVECTGVVSLVQQAAHAVAPGGIVCLTGVGPPSASASGAASALATDAVLKNLVVFGSVNANRRHYYRAAKVLAAADRSWLEQLITRRVASRRRRRRRCARTPDDIKVVMEFAQP